MILMEKIRRMAGDSAELIESPALDRRTNLPIVTETRQATPFRALPRAIMDRIVGNEAKGIIGLETSKKFLVRYQELIGQYVSAVRCWKCGVPIVAYQPALRPIEGHPNAGELTTVTLNGKEMVVGAILPFSHYREGLFEYRIPGRNIKPVPSFSYLHCADCQIKDEDGEDLLACLLGQFDHRRDHMKAHLSVLSDDEWAQYMFGWSGIELVGKVGPSISPSDMMRGT